MIGISLKLLHLPFSEDGTGDKRGEGSGETTEGWANAAEFLSLSHVICSYSANFALWMSSAALSHESSIPVSFLTRLARIGVNAAPSRSKSPFANAAADVWTLPSSDE